MKTLKKINFGVFAFLLGLMIVFTQSAFKGSPVKSIKRAPLTLYYHSSNYSEAEVENPDNWTTSPNSETCDGQNRIPCRITIDEAYVSGGQLQSSANLQAAEYTPANTFFVASSADSEMTISNKNQ